MILKTLVLFIVTILMAVIVSISGKEMHFCEALKDNNQRISYALDMPQESKFNTMFIIIKDLYWEMKFKVNSRGQSAVVLEPPMGRSSQFFAGDYGLAFAARHGRGLLSKWTQNTIGLINKDYSSLKWSVFGSNTTDLNSNSSQTSAIQLGGFKPHMAFTGITGADNNQFTALEQWPNRVGNKAFEPRFEVYYFPDPTKPLKTQTSTKRAKAVIAVAQLYYIKGLFGYRVHETDKSDDVNSMLVLIEECERKVFPCTGSVTYKWCAIIEDEDIQSSKRCTGNKLQTLMDCSQYWSQTTLNNTDTRNGQTQGAETGLMPGSHKGNTDTGARKTYWIYIIIAIIIFVVILVSLLAFIFLTQRKQSKPTVSYIPRASSAPRASLTPRAKVKPPVNQKPIQSKVRKVESNLSIDVRSKLSAR